MLIDSHAHLNFNAYKDDATAVIKRTLDNDVWMVNVGSQYSTSRRAVEIAEKYPQGVYAAIGLHPIHLETGLVKIKSDPEEIQFNTIEEEFDGEKYKELAKSEKVVAIGEIGLDYYWKPKTKSKLALFKQKQKDSFLKQVELAKELGLPVILHCRMAHDDLLEMVNSEIKGVVHCFTGDLKQAEKYLAMGFYLGFNGLIFKMDFDEIIRQVPLNRILIETDCPYLTPPQQEGRNEPLYVKYVAEKIAQIKGLTFEEIAKITTQNAKELFKI
jgi:TatD DNase family protein